MTARQGDFDCFAIHEQDAWPSDGSYPLEELLSMAKEAGDG